MFTLCGKKILDAVKVWKSSKFCQPKQKLPENSVRKQNLFPSCNRGNHKARLSCTYRAPPPPPTSFNWCHIFKACFLSHWEEASKRNMNKRNIICQTRNRSCNKSDWLSSSHVSISAIFVMKITLWLESHSGPCARARLCRAHPADWLLISPHTCHPSSHQLWRILNMFSTSPSAIQASVWLSFVTLTWPRRWFDHRAPV